MAKTASTKTTDKSNDKNMALVGLIVNLFVPGVGTIVAGNTKTGVWQLILCIVGFVLSFVLVGIPLLVGVWIWALIWSIKHLQAVS